jgi:hypothetical protein
MAKDWTDFVQKIRKVVYSLRQALAGPVPFAWHNCRDSHAHGSRTFSWLLDVGGALVGTSGARGDYSRSEFGSFGDVGAQLVEQNQYSLSTRFISRRSYCFYDWFHGSLGGNLDPYIAAAA